MTRTGRAFNLISGVFLLICSYALFTKPGKGLDMAASLLIAWLFIFAIRNFFYYFTMARFMVGGKTVLIAAVFSLDLAMFTSALYDYPRIYVVLYLMLYHAFSGLVNILRGLEAKKVRSPEWLPNVVHGSIDVAVVLSCIVFIKSTRILVYAYSATLAWSAIIRIISSFRRTAVLHIGP